MLSNLAFVLPRLPLPLCRVPRQSRQFTKAVIRPNIAVVGGGHAGLSVALRLITLPWTRLTRPSITLIDPKDRFLFLPMLYELALDDVERWEVAPLYRDLLSNTGITFLQGSAENIDLLSGVVEGSKSNGGELHVPYDRLVVAVGAECAGMDRVEGAVEHAIPFYQLEDAQKLKEKIETVRRRKRAGEVCNVIVIGGGFGGVEIASCLSERLASAASVMIVESGDKLIKSGTEYNRNASQKALIANGGVVLYETRVEKIEADRVVVMNKDGNKEEYPADIVIWTAGARAKKILDGFDMPLDERGRVVTDEFLQVKGLEDRVYALGDAAGVKGESYYGTAQVAVQQAEYVGWNCWASLTGKGKLEYRYGHLGEMMVLGGKNATVSTSVGVEVDGAGAWAMRRLAYLARMPTERHRGRVAASWAVHPLLRGMGDLVRESRKYRSGASFHSSSLHSDASAE